MPLDWIEIAGIFTGYLLGSLCTGYYLVRISLGKDIRDYGSGGVGARNAGRLMGKKGFFLTMLGDTLKGIIAVAAAKYLGFSPFAVILVTTAVIAGHVWPVTLGFRGGKGVATSLGTFLVYDYRFIVILFMITGLVIFFLRRFTISGMLAYAALPVILFALDYPIHGFYAALSGSLLVLYSHKENLKKTYQSIHHNR